MEGKAVTKGTGISPRKVRIVADAIRNMPVIKAMQLLQVADKRGSYVLQKTLKSAVANAVNNANLDANDLYIARLEVNAGLQLKRMHMAARGRVRPYKKRTSHVTIVVASMAKKSEKKVEDKTVVEPVKKAEKGATNN